MTDFTDIYVYAGLVVLSMIAMAAVVGYLWGHHLGRLEGKKP